MRITLWHVLVWLAGAVVLAAAPLPHVDSDAPLYGRIAANVVTSGDWVTFHHPGWLVDKPPVVFWMMAASFRLLGISDATMRLWQLLLALALLVLTAGAARAAGASQDESLLAALVLATSLQVFYQVTVPQQDVPLTLFLALAAFALMRYIERGTAPWAMLSGGAVALAVLTKGLAGLALYGMVLAAALLLVRRSLPHPRLRVAGHALAGTLVFVAVAFPWYVHGVVVHGQVFVDTFLTTGTLGVGRFFRPAISTPPPYWLSLFAYVPLLGLGLLPWTPAFLVGLADLPRQVRQAAPGSKIVAAWLLGIFVMLSLSSGDKVFRYLLPVYPPAAIVAARGLTAMVTDVRRRRFAGWAAVIPAVLLIAAGFWTLWAAFPPERGLLVAVVLPTVVMIVLGLVIFGIGALAGRVRAAIIGAALCAMIAYAAFERGMLANAAAVDPWPAIVRASAPYVPAGDRLVLYGRVGEVFNFAHFHFETPIVAVNAIHELGALWQRERILVVVPAERLDELSVLRPAPVVIHRSPARLVVVVNWDAPR
ncbi:MAG: glycosyltransferase family 39 protein [Armatimonadota bacterium]|nr:glycosyltransferase family 39 protein [Armatimonadota bacterium]